MDDVLKKIDKLRREKNLSVFKLTALSDLSENTIYNWYRKGSSPTLYALRSVCNVLNVICREFLRKIRRSIFLRRKKLCCSLLRS